MLHSLIKTWFHWVEAWGYPGVFLLMALESSIVPVPSEIVMPPAAFFAAQGKMNFWLVVVTGTAGSWFGSALSYWVAHLVGNPVLRKYGRFVMLGEEKLEQGENWLRAYGAGGIFLARFLPVVRHLVSIPAGVLKMDFAKFSIATILGAGAWCLVLSWFGQQVLGARPDLLDSPEAMISAVKAKLLYFVVGVCIFAALYVVMTMVRSRVKPVAKS